MVGKKVKKKTKRSRQSLRGKKQTDIFAPIMDIDKAISQALKNVKITITATMPIPSAEKKVKRSKRGQKR